MHIKVKKQRPIKTKENRMKHPLQPDSAKFNQYKGFCTAVDYKPLKWPLSDWKFPGNYFKYIECVHHFKEYVYS